MKYLEKPMHTCDVCGKNRRWGDHTECSKKRKEMHKGDKRPSKSKKKVVSKSSQAYFENLLKLIGE